MDKEFWFLTCGLFGAWLLLMATNPVRASLRDGFRCVRRHPSIWGVLAVFGLANALVQLGQRVFFRWVLPEGQRPIFQWDRAWFLPMEMQREVLQAAILPAAESVAGIFNNVVTTFPCSAVAAVLLLVNWGGHHVVLRRALRRRFGAWGWALYFGITVCALAAVVKPLAYVALPLLGQSAWGWMLLPAGAAVDWLSFLFEYLFGVCVQIYLILLAYVWVRGVNHTREHLLDFAIRRFSFVVRWALVVMVLSSVLIHLPLVLSLSPLTGDLLRAPVVLDYIDRVARPVLAGFLLAFPAMQITLTFHGESLRAAVRDHFTFLRRHAWPAGWLVFVAAVHFYLLNVADGVLVRGKGEGTALVIGWRLCLPLVQAMLAGWLLASWVCLYKRCEHARPFAPDWVRF